MPAEHPHAFPKTERVRQRTDYLAVQGQGRKLQSDSFLFFVAPTRGPGGAARVGFTVSKKVGNAVVRNRIKRRLREFYRTHKALFPPGQDVVVIAKPSAARLEHAAATAEMERLCVRCSRR